MKASGLLVVVTVQLGCSASDGLEAVAPLLRLEEVTRYGSTEGEGSALTRVAGVAVTDSTVLILESDPPRVAVFSHDGEWQRDIGRAGDGPGKFRRPSHVGIVENRIWVGDPNGGRLEVFGSRESPIASYRWDIPPDSLGARAFPTALLSDGSVLAGPGALNIGAASRGAVTHRSYVRATPAGERMSVLYREVLDPADFFQAEVGSRNFIVGMHPIRSSPLVALYPDGSGIIGVERDEAESADESTFRIRVVAADGTNELDVAIRYEPVNAEGWLERYLAEVEEDMIQRTGSADRGLLDALRGSIVERRFYPPVTSVRAGSDGSIWVRREETPLEIVVWQVHARSGRRVGQLSIPKEVDIVHASLHEVWAVELDAFDVPFVVRYRVLE